VTNAVLKRIAALTPEELFSDKPVGALPKRIVFLLSTARTGTKAFAEGLTGQGIENHHQPPGSRILTCASNLWLNGLFPTRGLYSLVRRIRLPQIRGSMAHHYIQSFAFDHVAARILHDAFDNVRVIHIVRDPRTFVPSYLNWTHTRLKSYIANKAVPGWHPNGWLAGEFTWRQWQVMNEFQRVCWHWRFKNELLETLFSKSARYMRLRFEDIMFGNQRKEMLANLLSFLDIPYEPRFEIIFEKKKNVSEKTYFPRYADWPSERKYQLAEFCDSTMERYGYAPDEPEEKS
jgi:hypothetical protein